VGAGPALGGLNRTLTSRRVTAPELTLPWAHLSVPARPRRVLMELPDVIILSRFLPDPHRLFVNLLEESRDRFSPSDRLTLATSFLQWHDTELGAMIPKGNFRQSPKAS
jgi:hypothetical protein